MPRRRGKKFDAALKDMRKRNEVRSVEEREHMPDKPCGKCTNFYQSTAGSAHCNILYSGSDIEKDPPVYKLEGELHYSTIFNMDAKRCKYYEKMKIIDTDISQSSDPMYSRHQRQMQK